MHGMIYFFPYIFHLVLTFKIVSISMESDLYIQRTNWWFPERKEDVGLGQVAEGEWEVQTSSYGMNKSWEEKIQHKEYSQWYCNSVYGDRW